MHVGMSTFFQNLSGDHTDGQVYAHEIEMADMAEPLGFDSIWAAEHHFDEYTMCPNVAQFLTYMAGRTSRVGLGSMVMVLPWHDPIRLTEEVLMLDHVSNGRTILGVGRGLGRIEFEGFRINMGESRERFVEYAEAILNALETGHIEADGKFYKQPRTAIRPFPFQSFRGRTYAAAVSPESARIMARLGIGILIIAQKPWDKTIAELDNYRAIYREINNMEAPKPIIASFIACHEDPSVARDMYEKYIRGYSRSALNHYEFHNKGLADIKGYEYYGALAENIEKHGTDQFVDFLAKLQIWGTPDQVYEQIMENQKRVDAAGLISIFSFGGMPQDLAKQNMQLFAEKVLPRLKAHDVGADIGGKGQAVQVAAE
jgi:alkanesulfonate monooxygenase SsuD/methylene tetrahydromethanopterin reductase-like flavin-dependent oxidoreductase (luciferase family)|tara:strand:+ start:1323 stop:2438 length:1116 start_codon:yes stop_codon:yes gene_type:complete